jgi:hypothetical protein
MPLPKGGDESDRSAEQTHTKQRHIKGGVSLPQWQGAATVESKSNQLEPTQHGSSRVKGQSNPGPKSPSGGVMCESVESYLCGTRVQPLPVRVRIWNGNAKATNQSSLSSQCVLEQPRA